MLIYIINFMTIPLYSLLIKNKRVQVFVVGIQMLLILSFRSMELGSDLENYCKYYNTWSTYSLEEMIQRTGIMLFHGDWGLESGYVWLNWLSAKIGLDFQGFLIIVSIICMASLCHFLNTHAENKMLAMAIMISFGLYTSFFYILRQSIALSILLFSIDSIKYKKKIRFFSIVFLAFLFHRASIVFSLIYFACEIKISKLTFLAVYLCSVLELILIPSLYNRVLLPFLKVIGKADIYSELSFQSNNMIICMLALSVVILILTGAGHFFDSRKYCVFFWSLVFAIFIEVLSLYVPVFSRIAICIFFPLASVLLADVFTKQRLPFNRRILISGSYLILFVFYLYNLSGSSIVPYQIRY